jgi:hypothetical protein
VISLKGTKKHLKQRQYEVKDDQDGHLDHIIIGKSANLVDMTRLTILISYWSCGRFCRLIRPFTPTSLHHCVALAEMIEKHMWTVRFVVWRELWP